jgi:hypothetical protein
MKNPPAFPNPNNTTQEGMTLRDYFAAKAMQGFISASTTQLIASDVQLQARSSYFVADAMLKAREA